MREQATLKLDDGAEVRVEVDPDELDQDEIIVYRPQTESAPSGGGDVGDELIAWMDKYLATAKRHPAGTTDRFLAADRERAY